MPPQSYARTTTSSRLKTQPPPSNESPSSPPSTPKKKLSRPSTLTPEQRRSITYRSDLHAIKPHDPNKPCPLAALPSELRTQIYQHVLDTFSTIPLQFEIRHARTRKRHLIWPTLLHISRAIRIEAAYVYYTRTPFTFDIHNLDFTQVRTWLDALPPRHRGLLARNRTMTLHVSVQPGNLFWSDLLSDSRLNEHWRACAPFGNLYTVASTSHRRHFVFFCRMMSWFTYTAAGPMRAVKWRYKFEDVLNLRARWTWVRTDAAEMMWEFLRDAVRSLGMGCVERAWTRGRDGPVGKEQALVFLNSLDEAFGNVREKCKEEIGGEWDTVMRRLKGLVEKW